MRENTDQKNRQYGHFSRRDCGGTVEEKGFCEFQQFWLCLRNFISSLFQKNVFWKSCKPYFSNKHSFGESKIPLSENDEFLTENNKIAKTFNSFFETITDSLN